MRVFTHLPLSVIFYFDGYTVNLHALRLLKVEMYGEEFIDRGVSSESQDN